MNETHPQLTELETRLEMSAFFDGGIATPQNTFRCCGKWIEDLYRQPLSADQLAV